MLVVVDTNILLSGLFQIPGAMPTVIVDAIAYGQVEMLSSRALSDEYGDVLSRPRIQRFLRLSVDETWELHARILHRAHTIDPPPSPVACPDPADQHLWDLLAAYDDAVLVTGERILRMSRTFPERVFTPREFVERFLTAP